MYEKTNWKKGNTISSEKMNKIENKLDDTDDIESNLSRSLESTGNDIQKIFKNSNGIINMFPFIEFTATPNPDDDTKPIVTISKTRGIDDPTNFSGPCYIKVAMESYPFPVEGIGHAYRFIMGDSNLAVYNVTIIYDTPMLFVFMVMKNEGKIEIQVKSAEYQMTKLN